MSHILISPSILSANLLTLKEEINLSEKSGADLHHIDVMDGHFVPNLSFGLPLISAIKKNTSLPLDVHIMVANPDQVFTQYLQAGADYLTFHIEAAKDPIKIISAIKAKHKKAGIAINPDTPLKSLLPEILETVDLILVMGVFPGFSGQSFIQATVGRTKKIFALLQEVNPSAVISVDGGVSDKNARQLQSAGANILVAGSYIYNAKNRQKSIASLKS
jgi:ribulose-phosphate 3-epimerase